MHRHVLTRQARIAAGIVVVFHAHLSFGPVPRNVTRFHMPSLLTLAQ